MVNIILPSRYKLNRKLIKKKAQEILDSYGFLSADILNIVFVGKNKMRSIAKEYKKEDVALPVLSFNYQDTQDKEKLIGEIFICYPQTILLAAEREKGVDITIINLIKHGIENIVK